MIHDFSREPVYRRAGPDVERHHEKVDEAIREGFAKLVTEANIIAGGKKQKLAIPIRAYPEYAFEFGQKEDHVGSGPEVERNDLFLIESDKIPRHAGPGGTEPGEHIIEYEVTLEDLDEFLFQDLALPDFVVKRLRLITIREEGGLVGITRHGPLSRLHRRATKRAQIQRVAAQRREGGEVDEGFWDEDLRFRRLSERIRHISSAVVICMMDVSGSMDEDKKFLARAFFWLLARFVRSKYEETKVIFIIHEIVAKEVDENDFFHTFESGGTAISSAYELAEKIVGERFPPEAYNIYAFHCSDGDNSATDNDRAYGAAERLLKLCTLFGYGEIDPAEDPEFASVSAGRWSTMFDVLHPLADQYDNFGFVKLRTKEDIYPNFCALLNKERVKGEVR